MCYLALGVIGVCITPGRNGFGYGGDITHCSNSYCLIILDVPQVVEQQAMNVDVTSAHFAQ